MALAVPASVEELYDSRGEDVPLARPLLQGDLFSNVDIPGLGDRAGLAMITMHPCSMRTGPVLRKRLTVVRVAPHRDIPLEQWPGGDYDFMPLPEVTGEAARPMLAANFRMVGVVKTDELHLERRIAVLSTRGLLYLQQRKVHSDTRVVIDLETLFDQMAPVLDEVELQEDWAELAVEADGGASTTLDVIREAEASFQAYLGGADSDLRASLRDKTKRASARRRIRDEARSRFT